MSANEWTVVYVDNNTMVTDRVFAEGWQIGPNGDLVFGDGLYKADPFPTRAFAAGTWLQVSLYA